MAGHSKWAKIKRQKQANDAQRSQFFSKLTREITVAVKQGGPVPETNFRLKLAIQHAKAANMPKENIERALQKGSGDLSANYVEITYEGYAPHGIAVMMLCITDNINRTVASVRSIFSKHSGRLEKKGALSHVFVPKGVFTLPATELEEETELALIEAGAEEITQEDALYVICPIESFGRVQQQLELCHKIPTEATLQYVPQRLVPLEQSAFLHVMKLIKALTANEDVQQVYHTMLDPS